MDIQIIEHIKETLSVVIQCNKIDDEVMRFEYYGAAGFFRKYPFSLLNIQNCVIRYR